MSGARATGGGRFDPDEPYIFFSAGVNLTGAGDLLPHSLMAVNDVFASGGEGTGELRGRLADPEHKLLFDSGIFWLSNEHAKRHGLTHDEALATPPAELDDFDKLLTTYTAVVREHEDDLWGYIELDQGGADRKRETRARLEADGLRPIPVYHPILDGWDYFDELAESYDRVCVGNLVQADRVTRWRIMQTVWERRRRFGKGGPWLHLLGVSASRSMLAFGFNSSDSSQYVYSLRYGRHMLGTRSMFGGFAKLGDEYVYDRGNYDDDERGRAAHARLLSYLAVSETFAMRSWWRELAGVFDVAMPYPAVVKGEPEPVPAEAA